MQALAIFLAATGGLAVAIPSSEVDHMKPNIGGRCVPLRCERVVVLHNSSMRNGTRNRERMILQRDISVALRATLRQRSSASVSMKEMNSLDKNVGYCHTRIVAVSMPLWHSGQRISVP